MRKRPSISKRTRFLVMERDCFRCSYCGATAPDVKLHIDHKVPLALGGAHHESNFVTACEDCNLGKAALELQPRVPLEREHALAVEALLGLFFFGDCQWKTPLDVIRALETLIDTFGSECDMADARRRIRACKSWDEAKREIFRDFPGGYAANDCEERHDLGAVH